MEKIYDHGKVIDGIRAVGDAMDSLGLTLVERFEVVYSYDVSLRSMLGEKYGELERVMFENHPDLVRRAGKTPEKEKKPAE